MWPLECGIRIMSALAQNEKTVIHDFYNNLSNFGAGFIELKKPISDVIEYREKFDKIKKYIHRPNHNFWLLLSKSEQSNIIKDRDLALENLSFISDFFFRNRIGLLSFGELNLLPKFERENRFKNSLSNMEGCYLLSLQIKRLLYSKSVDGIHSDTVLTIMLDLCFVISEMLDGTIDAVFAIISEYDVLSDGESESTKLDQYDNVINIFTYLKKPDQVARPTALKSISKSEEPLLEPKDKIQNGFSAAADPEAIGKVLTAAREEAGMTKAAVAAEMATVPKSIIRLEKGEQNPTIQTIDRFAKALGYTVRIEFLKNNPE